MKKRLIKKILNGHALGRISSKNDAKKLLRKLHDMGYKIHLSDRSNFYKDTKEKGVMTILDEKTGDFKFPDYVDLLRIKYFYLDSNKMLVYFMVGAEWDDRYTRLTKSRGYPCLRYEDVWELDNLTRDKLKALHKLGKTMFIGNKNLCCEEVSHFALEWMEEIIYLANQEEYNKDDFDELRSKIDFIEKTEDNKFYFAYFNEVERLLSKHEKEKENEND